jgi:hypothetical protein
MNAAAAAQEFERAARLRDLWQPLAWLDEQLRRVARAEREYDFVLESPCGRRAWWHVIRAGRLRALFPAPVTPRSWARAREWIARLCAQREVCEGSPQAAVGQVLCLVRWFEQAGADVGRRLAFAEVLGEETPGRT